MTTIRPSDLPASQGVSGSDVMIVDKGSAIEKATAAQVLDAAYPLATQAQAEAGSDNATRVTPLRVKQAIDATLVTNLPSISFDDYPGDGDDTDAFAWMLEQMRSKGRPGLIIGTSTPEGRRLTIREGQLVWSFTNTVNLSADVPGPEIQTYGKVVLVAAGAADAPLLAIHNDKANSVHSDNTLTSRFISGGFVGPLHFEDANSDDPTGRHAIEIVGVLHMRFGEMTSKLFNNDIFHIPNPPLSDGLTNDAWQVHNCVFEGITYHNATNRTGYAFNNRLVSQGFNYSTILNIWALYCEGAFKGVGAGNSIQKISAGWTSGLAVDLTCSLGSTQFCEIGNMEIDAPREGVRIGGLTNANIGKFRIIYRNGDQWGSLGIPAGVTWPEKPIYFTDDADGVGGQITNNVTGEVTHRFNDINQAQLPATIVDYGGVSTHSAVALEHRHQAEFEVPLPLFVANLNIGTRAITIIVNDKVIEDTKDNGLVIARLSSGAGGVVYSPASPLLFDNVQVDRGEDYDPLTGVWTCPASGDYRLHIQLLCEPDADDLVRVGFFLNGGGNPFREMVSTAPAGMGVGKIYPVSLNIAYPFIRGDEVVASFYDARSRLLLSGSAGTPDNNYLEIVRV